MSESHPSSSSEIGSDLEDAGRAIFRLGRIFDRQRVREVLSGRAERSVELSRIFAVQAVEAGVKDPEQEVTVGIVAERLGVDPSTASRLVAQTIRDGYLSRATSEEDGRRSRLKLTEAGRELAADAGGYQRAVFEELTRDWPEDDRREFARLLSRFVDSVAGNLDPR